MAQATVLVIDDDPTITTLLRAILEDEGYQVLTAVNEAAIEIARRMQPKVILLDLMMPGMDGVEVGKRLRADPTTATIPIVLMSASHVLTRAASQIPIDDQLSKPFEIDSVYAVVARWAEAH